jgi:hypothetical protein
MGHNFTLNTPASYYYGGRIDGDANAIFSESMAQIFQHAAGYEIINNYQTYGLSDDLVLDIKQSMLSSMSIVRISYDQYLASGKNYSSWNNPATPSDETFGTFITVAFTFCEHAENSGQGYRAPLKRMMRLLQGFNPNWAQRYDCLNNTAAADTFRATLMVTALSYAFSTDLRSEFRNLNFPISDQTYDELYGSVTSVKDKGLYVPAPFRLDDNFPNPFNPSTTIGYVLPHKSAVQLNVYNIVGQQVASLVNDEQETGYHELKFDGSNLASGVYFYRLQAGAYEATKKLLLIR